MFKYLLIINVFKFYFVPCFKKKKNQLIESTVGTGMIWNLVSKTMRPDPALLYLFGLAKNGNQLK